VPTTTSSSPASPLVTCTCWPKLLPVATTIQGKGVFPESHPLFLWNGLGAAAPPFVRALASERTVMLLQINFSNLNFYFLIPKKPQSTTT